VRVICSVQAVCSIYNSEMMRRTNLPATCSILSGSLVVLLWTGVGSAVLAQSSPQPAADTAQAAPPTPAEMLKRSWDLLTDSVQNAKLVETRAQALNALSGLGANPRANGLIAAAMKDPNLDIRTAAILAAGKTKSRTLIEPVKALLNDPEPQVVFAAAATLWRQFKDKSGEDVLDAIASGDRKANPSLVHGAKHDIARTLHDPSALEKIGITTGASLLLGPFGFSVSAIEYARKNGSDTSRVLAIEMLGEDKTQGVHDDMRDALGDKDAGVRAAAARVLATFHRPQDAKLIAPLLDDSKAPVRLAAAAAYIDCLSGVAKAKRP
jgi:HEAT repeat protein